MNFYEGLARMEKDDIMMDNGTITFINLNQCESGKLYPYHDTHTGEKLSGSYIDVYEFKK